MFAPTGELSRHPVDIGIRSEAAIIGELSRRGYRVLLPFSFNSRYDLILDIDGKFVRVQCKTGRMKNGAIMFPTLSTRSSTTGTFRRNYEGEVDLFIVYCPANEKIYVVPIEEAAKGFCSLRVDPPANGQAKRIRLARDYELPG